MILASVLLFLAFVYFGIMTAYWLAWRRIPEWHLPPGFIPDISVSVIIAARNEALHITDCLISIQNGSYPPKLLEIIVADDFSEDETAALTERFIKGSGGALRGFKLLRLSELLPPEHRFTANKKKAIELAVEQAAGDLIVTTDADCLVPENWLMLLVSRFTAAPELKILAAPVMFHREINLLQRFQALDFSGMMGITGAGMQLNWHRMGNGANLAYRKTAFQELGGYTGNDQVASGDDMFLIQKMAARWPDAAGFFKSRSATVLTEAKADWREFWHQRLRWGTKNAALPEWRMRLILLAVWLFCSSICLSLILVLTGQLSWIVLLIQLLLKGMADWFLLREMCGYFGRKDLLYWFLSSFFLHTAYIAVLGFAGVFFRKYTWKGRQVGSVI